MALQATSPFSPPLIGIFLQSSSTHHCSGSRVAACAYAPLELLTTTSTTATPDIFASGFPFVSRPDISPWSHWSLVSCFSVISQALRTTTKLLSHARPSVAAPYRLRRRQAKRKSHDLPPTSFLPTALLKVPPRCETLTTKLPTVANTKIHEDSSNTAKLSSPIVLPRTVSYGVGTNPPPRAGNTYLGMAEEKTTRRRRSSSILQIYQEPQEPIEQLSDQSALPNLNAQWVNAKGTSHISIPSSQRGAKDGSPRACSRIMAQTRNKVYAGVIAKECEARVP